MYAQLAFITVGGFVASVIHGDNDVVYTTDMCKAPNFTYWKDCGGTDAGYYFNSDKGRCVILTDSGCPNQTLFQTRKRCADCCGSAEGPKNCTDGPKSPCNPDQKGKRRYYYNITTGFCSQYNRCGKGPDSLEENSFYSKSSCERHCKGFTMEDKKAG
ncbi:BPTI/Kunitz domain-containing protein 5-like [Dermacentor andersoni]|uniref:BPTI/Kunitz domain-containing protein 5-like n=1 Tax=Dermacentor andersoni TaxID=34620 RepID=UPI002155280D|nr:BPTI/Kunitz domain-containing protein 5-like [Dermacentor andersoni]